MEITESTATKLRGSWQLTVIAVLLVVAAVTYLGPILKPLFSAVFVYFLIRPVADWLKQRGCAPWLAYLMLFVAASAAVLGLLGVVAINAVRFQDDWPQYRVRIMEAASHWGIEDRVREGLKALTPEKVISFVVGAGTDAAEFGLMLVFYLLYLIFAAPKFPARVNKALPRDVAVRVNVIGEAVAAGMARYMEVKTVVNAGLALSVALVLAWFGIDYWLLWAALIFVLNYVTYIGALVAIIPPILLGFLQLTLPSAFLFGAILFLIRFIWIDILEVRMSGRHVNIDSMILLVFMSYWGGVWGLIGLVLAVPIATCIRAGLNAVDSTRPLALLMSED